MKRLERWLLWTGTASVGLSGIAYFFVKYFMEPEQPWDLVAHPIEPWLLRTHILTVPILVFALGMVWTDHIWRHYVHGTRSGRRTGSAAMWVTFPMILTGYLIQVVTHQGWLRATEWAHIGSSVVFLVGFTLHARVFRDRWRTRRRARSSTGAADRSAGVPTTSR